MSLDLGKACCQRARVGVFYSQGIESVSKNEAAASASL